MKMTRPPTEADSTYTRPAALTVLAFAAESRVLTEARRGKIKFVNFATNSATQSDVSSPVAASSRDTAVEGPPCIKTVEDHFTHGLPCAISDCSGTSLRKSKSSHFFFQNRLLSATRTANCSASFGGSSGRPGSVPSGRQAAHSSDFSTTFLRARDRPVGNIQPIDRRMRRKSAAITGQPAMPIGREWDGLGRSHSCSFDQRRRPETLRTAMATAFFCPTSTTSRLPRVTPV